MLAGCLHGFRRGTAVSLVRRVLQIRKHMAEKYTKQGLALMTTSTAPWDSLELVRRAGATYRRLCEAHFLEAKALLIPGDAASVWFSLVAEAEWDVSPPPPPTPRLLRLMWGMQECPSRPFPRAPF